ncbi:polysaccharide deacetylase family protein [Streptomyces odontomachi]|uniref:polysaccharide deacetylase family protein n=1 Tax=Streptomyces odontomachi TaxID=2944940 RepID=UPI00210D9681|nr:polysaccharide deacetylase family protein [Streptomyces sp. ODS25]
MLRAGLLGPPVLATASLIVHAAPVVSTFGPLRNRVMPRLAGQGRADHVALTFDDGPDRLSTPHFLKALDARGVHATFFVLGSMLVRAPGVAREMVAAGHEIGIHGWHHRPLLLRGPRATHEDLARARDAVAGITGEPPRLFRPPYGVLTTAAHLACRRLDLTPVLWTAWGEDWRRRATPRSVHDTVARDLTGGGTVLLHDSDCTSAPGSWRNTLAALPRILDTCTTRGWRVGPLRDHGVPG